MSRFCRARVVEASQMEKDCFLACAWAQVEEMDSYFSIKLLCSELCSAGVLAPTCQASQYAIPPAGWTGGEPATLSDVPRFSSKEFQRFGSSGFRCAQLVSPRSRLSFSLEHLRAMREHKKLRLLGQSQTEHQAKQIMLVVPWYGPLVRNLHKHIPC